MNRTQWQNLADQGIACLRQNQPREGLQLLQKAARQAPGDRVLRYWLANAHRMNGDTQRAEGIFRKLLAEKRGDFDPSFGLAFLLRDGGRPGDAANVLVTASEQPGVALNQLLQITGFLRDSNQFAAAIPVCQRALKLNMGSADLHFKLARLYQATGAFDKAETHLKTALDLKPSIGPAWTILAQQHRFESEDDPEFLRLQAASSQSHGHEADMCIAFAHGKALDDLGRWPQAWSQYQKGNELLSLTRLWNRDAWNRLLQGAQGGNRGSTESSGDFGAHAVFIVGMPRSGTTLLEQLLARQPHITGRGELNFLDHLVMERADSGPLTEPLKRQMGERLWSQLRLDGPEDGFYVDKNPLNFRYLDTLFEIMPAARVLHMKRDGRASCLSCYFQPFEHNDSAFSNHLDHLVEFYSGYRQLMETWDQAYPGRILQVDYDELVQSSDEVMDRVLKFIGAQCDNTPENENEAVALVRSASAWQARQPIHTRSVERWRHYYEQAPEFFDRLAAIDERS